MITTSARPRTNKIMINGDRLEFWFDYDFTQKEFVKMQLRARFTDDSRGKFWALGIDKIVPDLLDEYCRRFKPEASQSVRVLYAPVEARIVAPETIKLSSAQDADISNFDLDGFMIDLFPFQKAGVKYMAEKKRALCGDDMGLGKTYQALAAVRASNAHDRFIVVSPATVKPNWRRATLKALPNTDVQVWDAKAGRSTLYTDCVVINYDNLGKRLKDLKAFGAKAIIFDEIHYLKNAKAQRTKAALKLADGIEYVFGLTGTPLMNRPVELASILELLGRLNDFGGYWPYVQRYCQAFKRMIWIKGKYGPMQKQIWDFSGAANLKELSDRLRASCMVRRRKTDVLHDLPAKTRVQVPLTLSNREQYEEAQNDIVEFLRYEADEDKAFKAEIAHMTEDQKKAAIAEYRQERADAAARAEHLVQMEWLKQLAAEGIFDDAVKWITNYLESGEKFVLFANHKSFLADFQRAFPQAARIVAEDDPEIRQRNIDQFVSDPDCNLLIASLKAGGTGVDRLQEACNAVGFFELGWTPAEHLQAEDRVYRIGQDRPAFAYYFIGENSIYEAIQTMLAEKQAVCESALDGVDEMRSGSIFNELVKEFLKR